jgi:hypothetical protein
LRQAQVLINAVIAEVILVILAKGTLPVCTTTQALRIEPGRAVLYLKVEMPTDEVNQQIKLHRALGVTRPPENVTQEAFEGNDRHLRRLVRLRPGEQADAGDLWEYIHDLRYADIQGALLVYLLPFCLQAWREDLRGIREGYGGVIENFYPVLADRHIFDLHLTPKQSAVVSEFMRQTILEEIDDQRGLIFQGSRTKPYRWFRAMTTYGVLLPDVERLWTAWWSLETVGRAIAAVQYISCLMYSENENPVFTPWTPERGGGPPCLWEFEGHLYAHRWLEPNVNFLRGILTVRSVSDVLVRAVERLVGQPEYDAAGATREDFPLCTETLQSRCAELPQLLETTQSSSTMLAWSA